MFCQSKSQEQSSFTAYSKYILGYSASSQLTVLGQFITAIDTNLKSVKFVIHVIQGNHGS